MTMNGTPTYIKSLLTPSAKKPNGRKAWSIDLQEVWLPFFTATNSMGDTAIPSEAIGCPMRLAYDKTGAVRFSQSGRPTIRIAKELGDSIKLVRDNFTANLLNYAGEVIREHGDDYKSQIAAASKAGMPIYNHDKAQLDKAVAAKAEAEAEAVKPPEVVAQAEAVVKEMQAEAVVKATKRNGKRELVTA